MRTGKIHRASSSLLAVLIAAAALRLYAAGGASSVNQTTPTSSPASQAASASPPTLDEETRSLVDAGVPEWASECAAGLIRTRDQWTNSKAGVQLEPSNQLCALDGEADLLISAMLALDEPSGAIVFSNLWYAGPPGKGIQFRTPISPLLLAQAYRLAAWDLLDPPPGQNVGDAVPDRIKIFSDANAKMAIALNLLEAQTSGLLSASNPSDYSLPAWIERGIIKAQTVSEFRNAMDGFARSKIDPSVQVDRIPAFQAIDYAKTYLEWESRVCRELGDMVYRETGSSVQVSEGAPTQSTALAYYGLARKRLYLARLLDPNDRSLGSEADQLRDRLTWIDKRQSFGGIDFFKFEPYDRQTYIPQAIVDLTAKVEQLRGLRSGDAQRVAAQASWLTQLRQNGANRKALQEAFSDEARRQIRARLLDLTEKINQITGTHAEEKLRSVQTELSQFVQQFGVQLSTAQYSGELERLRLQLSADLLQMIQDIARLGSLEPLRGNPDFDAVDAYIKGLSVSSQSEQLIRQAWADAVRSDVGTKRTTIDVLTDEAHARELRATETGRELDLYKQSEAKKALDAQAQQLSAAIQDLDVQDRENVAAETSKEKAALSERSQDNLKAFVIPQLQRQVDDFQQKAHDAIEVARSMQEKLQQLKDFVANIKEERAKLENAFDQLQGIIKAAKSLPVTLAAGVSSGTMFDAGEAIAQEAHAALDKLVAIYQGKLDTHSLDQSVDSMGEKVRQYLDKATAADQNLRDIKAKYDQATQKLDNVNAVRAEYAKQKNELDQERTAVASSLANTQAQVGKLDEQIRALTLQNLSDRHDEAMSEWAASLAKIARANLYREERLAMLRAQVERISQRDSEAQGAKQLIEGYTQALNQKIAKAHAASTQASDVVQRNDTALIEQIHLQVQQLQAELRRLDAPSNRVMTTQLMQDLMPALALAGNRTDPGDVAALKDEANQLLLRCARWLYVLTGDGNSIALASACQSSLEFDMALKEVRKLWIGARHAYSGTRHKVFVLHLDRPDLGSLDSDGRLIINTVADWPPVNDSINKPVEASGSQFALNDRAVWVYSHPTAVNGMSTFYLTRSAAESDGSGILTGAWLLARWTNDAHQQVEFPDPFVIPEIFRQGPVRMRWNGVVQTLRMTFDRNFGINPLVQDDFARLGNFQRFVQSLPATGDDFLEHPFAGQSQAHFFGLGLDNRWVVEIHQKGRGNDQVSNAAELANHHLHLDGIDIVLAYLFPTVVSTQAGQNSPVRPPDLAFLRSLPQPNKAAPAPIRAGTLQDQEISAAIRQEIAPLIRMPATEPASATFAGNVKPESSDSAAFIEPIQVADQVSAADHLLGIVLKSLASDYILPLTTSKDTFEQFGNGPTGSSPADRLSRFVAQLKVANDRYDLLLQYIEDLKQISDILKHVQLTQDESDALDKMVKDPIPPAAWTAKFAERVRNDPELENEAIQYVLNRLTKMSPAQEFPRKPTTAAATRP